jgi:hypothetical protein
MSPAWGREICGDLAVAESREWLCTNGIGGFARARCRASTGCTAGGAGLTDQDRLI